MKFLGRLFRLFKPEDKKPVNVESFSVEKIATHIISNCGDSLNTSAMMVYHSSSRQSISACIADIHFAINQITDIGYLSRNTARAIENQLTEEGLTMREFCHGNVDFVKQYVVAVVELETMYRNLGYVETKEATHTVRLLTKCLEFHRKTLISISKCL